MKNIKVLSHLYTGKSLSIMFTAGAGVLNRMIEESHINWKNVIKAFKAKDWDKVILLSDITTAINKGFNGKFSVKNGQVYHGDNVIHGYLFDKILEFFRGGLPYQTLLNFATKLYQNPSERARNELYKFLEKRNYTITPDGDVIGWKSVQNDYYSVHAGTTKLIKGKTNISGQVYNGVGEIIEMERAQVDDNPNNTCSFGLHIGSRAFSIGFHKGRLLVVKFSPADCVSVTTDHDSQKLRVSKYEVIGEEQDLNLKQDCSAKKYVAGPKRDSNGRFVKKA